MPYELVNMDEHMDEACNHQQTRAIQRFLEEGQFPPAPLDFQWN